MLISTQMTSAHLQGNLLGDPAVRELFVYLPPSYAQTTTRYATLYLLHGFGMHGRDWTVPFPHGGGLMPPVDEIVDAAIARHGAAECIVVFPDGWSRYGCSQWVDSAVNGAYARYVTEEVVPFVDAHYRTLPARQSRGVFGISSGGFGAWHLGTLFPHVFGAMHLISADSYFEHTHKVWFYKFYNSVYPQEPQGVQEGNFWSALCYGLASCYTPNPARPPYYVDLPVEYPSGYVVPELWERWLSFDPVVSWAQRVPALRQLRGILLDVGSNDEWDLHYGHRLLSRSLQGAGIAHDAVEHSGTHSGRLYERLQYGLQWFSDVLERRA